MQLFTLIFSQDIQKALSDMLLGMVTAIPKFITAAFILLAGMIVSKIVKKVIVGTLQKAKVDKLGDKLNEIDILANNNIEIKLSNIAGKMVYYMMMLIFIMTAGGVLDMPVLAELIQDVIKFVPNLIAAEIGLGIPAEPLFRSLLL